MKDLRERCEKLYITLYSYPHPPQDERMIQEFESFAREIRNEALKEAVETIRMCEPPFRGGYPTIVDFISALNKLKDTSCSRGKGAG